MIIMLVITFIVIIEAVTITIIVIRWGDDIDEYVDKFCNWIVDKVRK